MSSAKWRPFCLGLNVLKFEKSNQGQAMNCFHHFIKKQHHGKLTDKKIMDYNEHIEYIVIHTHISMA